MANEAYAERGAQASPLGGMRRRMLMLPRTTWHLTRWTIESWWTDNALRLAAAMSYYITFSLAPLLLIVIAVAGILMGNHNARDAIMQQARSIIGPSGTDALDAMATQVAQGAEHDFE